MNQWAMMQVCGSVNTHILRSISHFEDISRCKLSCLNQGLRNIRNATITRINRACGHHSPHPHGHMNFCFMAYPDGHSTQAQSKSPFKQHATQGTLHLLWVQRQGWKVLALIHGMLQGNQTVQSLSNFFFPCHFDNPKIMLHWWYKPWHVLGFQHPKNKLTNSACS